MIPVHTTAVVIIPPEDVWEPIQEIRREHDHNIRRWMPHITLFYPFIPHENFYNIQYDLQQTCKHIKPFSVKLDTVGHFKQRKGNFILWTGCEEQQEMQGLYKSLKLLLQNKTEVKKRPFHPHLTIGRMRDADKFEDLKSNVESSWQTIEFEVNKISLIWRNDPPDDVFRIEYEVPLGSE
ncbi:RNA 2',3'-cyclic phosphodiesterase [Candidatus Uabimicrobium amorphum]|uniref:RNA 2',3'-cyclic phosphodiesterase n=1 Tax=Uabimicrobium amorphum TaxID=2596890 RepID=A0A5S9IMK5_UABAM|nr:RNA 2',3'-cyclic phosphodiesterase [Candidatus Uabimicrobium amorphum]BBM84291.1 RNA 2',3'-cyclic phosphodiesterase [Candidatus Uabimicrobium amorphum]